MPEIFNLPLDKSAHVLPGMQVSKTVQSEASYLTAGVQKKRLAHYRHTFEKQKGFMAAVTSAINPLIINGAEGRTRTGTL